MSESMEVALLRQMMSEREARIELLQTRRGHAEAAATRVRLELSAVREQHDNAALEQQGERVEWRHTHAEARKELDALTRDLFQQMASLQKYVAMVQQQWDKAGQPLTDARSVMQMQAQLCKAMHSQGIADHQLTLAKQHAEALLKQLREALVQVEEERSRVELELMNALVQEDTATRTIENEFKEKLGGIQREIAQLEHDLEENSKGSDDEEESESEQDEEDMDEEDIKEAKQELIDMLHEQREKIASLEKENAKQLRRIASLKRRADDPDASEELGDPASYDDDSDDEEDGTEDVEDNDLTPNATDGLLNRLNLTEPEKKPTASKEEHGTEPVVSKDEDKTEPIVSKDEENSLGKASPATEDTDLTDAEADEESSEVEEN